MELKIKITPYLKKLGFRRVSKSGYERHSGDRLTHTARIYKKEDNKRYLEMFVIVYDTVTGEKHHVETLVKDFPLDRRLSTLFLTLDSLVDLSYTVGSPINTAEVNKYVGDREAI
jgi:hypothetical protein